jgi:hypothetical protein
MNGRRKWIVLCTASLLTWVTAPVAAQQADTQRIDGVWVGPWYRGMSSGKARFDIRGGSGTMELTNAESFGDGTHPLQKVTFDGKTFTFEAPGGGGAMTGKLQLNERGDQMKGAGKHEGFGVRFELARTLE